MRYIRQGSNSALQSIPNLKGPKRIMLNQQQETLTGRNSQMQSNQYQDESMNLNYDILQFKGIKITKKKNIKHQEELKKLRDGELYNVQHMAKEQSEMKNMENRQRILNRIMEQARQQGKNSTSSMSSLSNNLDNQSQSAKKLIDINLFQTQQLENQLRKSDIQALRKTRYPLSQHKSDINQNSGSGQVQNQSDIYLKYYSQLKEIQVKKSIYNLKDKQKNQKISNQDYLPEIQQGSPGNTVLKKNLQFQNQIINNLSNVNKLTFTDRQISPIGVKDKLRSLRLDSRANTKLKPLFLPFKPELPEQKGMKQHLINKLSRIQRENQWISQNLHSVKQHIGSNKNIPKSNLRNKSSGKNTQVNTSLNLNSRVSQVLRDKSNNTKTSQIYTQNQDIISTLGSKYERDQLKHKDSKPKSTSNKSKKSKNQSSMNSSKIYSSQGTLEQIVSSSNLHSNNNNSYQSLSNLGDITANFNSLQNSGRLNHNPHQVFLMPDAQGFRSSSQDNIINIQTPKNVINQFNPSSQQSVKLSNPLQKYPQNYTNIQLCQQSTERSNQSLGTDYSKETPVTATQINQSQSSQCGSIHVLRNQYQRPQNFSMSQRNSYSPVNQDSASNKTSSRVTEVISPAQFMEANPLSFQNTQASPIKLINHGAIMFQKLELFWKERLLKLNQSIQQIKEGAFSKDDIIKTMLENTETANYADQRINELIKEGVNIEQELQIEQLSKQLIIQQSEALQSQVQLQHLINEYQKLSQNSHSFQNDMEIIIAELKKKKQKYKGKIGQMEEVKTELKQVKDERDNLLEKLKIMQNQTSEKQIYFDQRIEEISKAIKDLETQKEQLLSTISQMKEERVINEKKLGQNQQDLHQHYQEQMKTQKQQVKTKYLSKLNEVETQLQNEFKSKLKEIQSSSETKTQSQSKLDKQTIDFLQQEIARLNAQLQETVSVKEHETILNHRLNQAGLEHENEIETIKQVFEQELRKAEKQVRQTHKKEEEKLKLSALQFEKSMEYEKSERLKLQSKYHEEMTMKDTQIQKIKDKISTREKELLQQIEEEKNKLKQLQQQLKQIEYCKKEEIDQQKLELTKIQVNQNLTIKELQAKVDQLNKAMDSLQITNVQQIDQKQMIIKERDMQLKHLQDQYHLIDHENISLKKKIKELEQNTFSHQSESQIQKDKYQSLLIRLKEIQNQNVWKLEREQERIKRLNQDFKLMKKLLKQDFDYNIREIQQNTNQTTQTMLKMISKLTSQLQIALRNIPNEEFLQLKNSFEILNKEKTAISDQLKLNIRELDELKTKLLQEQHQYQLSQQLQEKLHNENLLQVSKQIDENLKEIDKLAQTNSQLQDDVNQSRSENAILLQKMGELDTIFQELDFKLKNSENERDIFKQQLQFEEKSKHEESIQLRQQFQLKQDELIADFKDQCMKLRGEIEDSYNNKLKNKINCLKNKQQEEINEINKQVEKREAEIIDKFQEQVGQYEQQIEQASQEYLKLKKDYKKILHKYKQTKLKDQENISKIEEEVFKSLAKVNTTVGSISRKQAGNYSYISNSNNHHQLQQHSSIKVDRSFQNLTNHSMFKQHLTHSRDKSDAFRNNLTLQSLKNVNGCNPNQSFNSLISLSPNLLQNQSAITQAEYPKSTRNNYFQQLNIGGGNNNNVVSQLNYGQRTMHQSLVIQDNNCGQRKISPISRSLNQNEISNNSSFIIPTNGNHNWNPLVSSINNQNQIITVEDSKQTSSNQHNRNKLQESSLNRVLNVSGDVLNIGGGSNNGNDSFLVARSLSPKEKTGKFGRAQNLNVSVIK
ncbi:UNKNOWN [Stylonychia lemnae]|uniref:Uncharacterized protein n=1 Tax=Stylonychia lemnae TaxID=5949 RepID=A0A077ZU77_STYLE|nr:UNKNOWN [Stylonychia lemnae]|eukprot:CDW73129.1 UNKNOWN [Stylonychia lemnae]